MTARRGSALQARHGVAEIGAPQRQLHEIVGAVPDGLNHGIGVAGVIGGDDVEVGRRLLDLLQGLEAGFRVAGEIDEQSAAPGCRSRSCRTRT